MAGGKVKVDRAGPCPYWLFGHVTGILTSGAKTVLTINRRHGTLFMDLKCLSFVSFPGSDVHRTGHCRYHVYVKENAV